MYYPLNYQDYRNALNKFIETFFPDIEDIGKNIGIDIPGTLVLDRMKHSAKVNIAIKWDQLLADKLTLATYPINSMIPPIHMYLSLMANTRVEGVSVNEIKLTIDEYQYNVRLMTSEEFESTQYGLRNLNFRTSMVVGILTYLLSNILEESTSENVKAINHYLILYSFELTRQDEYPAKVIMQLLQFVKDARLLMPTIYPEILDTIKFDFSKE